MALHMITGGSLVYVRDRQQTLEMLVLISKMSLLTVLLMSGLHMLMMFLMFMPKVSFETVILVESNKVIQGPPITFGEFLQFIGIWLYMAMTAGFCWAKWFSGKNIDHIGKVHLSDSTTLAMSGWCYDAIIAALRFTTTPSPPFQDKFHEVCDLITAWNENMMDVFSPCGCHAWMSQCPSGCLIGHVQTLCLFLKSFGQWGLSIIWFVVP